LAQRKWLVPNKESLVKARFKPLLRRAFDLLSFVPEQKREALIGVSMDIFTKYNRKNIQDRQIDTLIDLSKGLLADGKVDQTEAEKFWQKD
jgi:hypothetical protein